MAKTKHSQNQDLQDEKMNRITENKSSKSANSDNPASDKWEIPSDWEVKEFGEVFTFLKTFSYSREQLTSEPTKDEIRNIHYGDIHSTS
jgi:hypothetical protein